MGSYQEVNIIQESRQHFNMSYTNLCSAACLHTPVVGGPGLLDSELEVLKIE